jgi:alkylation response protein AidB-like acyl-CoA dehydrogenase
MQVRGGRGYETAASLEARGEKPIPVEQAMRDLRINLIFEGSSEIMRLFIAREAVDPHLSRAGAMVDANAPIGAKLKGAAGLGTHFAGWLPGLVAGWGRWPQYGEYGELAPHLRFVSRAARKLGRTLFYAMTRFGPKLEKRQSVLFRLVDVGAELFAMAATCARARALVSAGGDRSVLQVADVFCRGSRRRIKKLFNDVFSNDDARDYKLAQNILGGGVLWLEKPNRGD